LTRRLFCLMLFYSKRFVAAAAAFHRIVIW